MKTLSYKLLMVSSLLAGTTATIVAPMSTFAKEMGQIGVENEENINFAVDSAAMKTGFEKTREFAQAMNEYSYKLLNTPDVNFKGISLGEQNTDLPQNIQIDQKKARENATRWNNELKKHLLNTLENIVFYDTTFGNYYNELIKAADTNDGDTLKEGIRDLQEDIKKNQQDAATLIQKLNEFRSGLEADNRAFAQDKGRLSIVLTSQDGSIKQDEDQLEAINNRYKELQKKQDLGHDLIKTPFILVGGLILLLTGPEYKILREEIEKLNQSISEKHTLNRIVVDACNSVTDMHTAIDNAVKSLEFMTTQWHALDIKYDHILDAIDKASAKAEKDMFNFVKIQLNVAKDTWSMLHKDAVEMQEGIKELKLEPTQH
ncbi:HBL/NHE enterotoxin family protein [Bacillus thuringiensis]